MNCHDERNFCMHDGGYGGSGIANVDDQIAERALHVVVVVMVAYMYVHTHQMRGIQRAFLKYFHKFDKLWILLNGSCAKRVDAWVCEWACVIEAKMFSKQISNRNEPGNFRSTNYIQMSDGASAFAFIPMNITPQHYSDIFSTCSRNSHGIRYSLIGL